MFDYGLDEVNACILPADLAAATRAAQKFTGKEKQSLEQAFQQQLFDVKTAPETGALVINEYLSVKEYSDTLRFYEALAPYISPATGNTAYLVWGCAEFVQTWRFEDGAIEIEHNDL